MKAGNTKKFITARRFESKKSLLEHLEFDAQELESRISSLGLTPAHFAALAKYKPAMDRNSYNIVESFYQRQLSFEEVDLLIGDIGSLNRLRKHLSGYIQSLFGGEYGLEYAETRARIGAVHKRIGVGPRLFTPALENIKDDIVYIMAETKLDDEVFNIAKEALSRMLALDTQIIYDTYIHSLESAANAAKNKVRRHANRLEDIVKERTSELEKLAKVDSLTGVMSHREILSQINSQINRVRGQKDAPFTVGFIDIDDFKSINDTLGHKGGDRQLCIGANWLSNLMPNNIGVGRIGGDEFCLIVPDETAAGVKKIIENKLPELVSNEFSTSMSIGLIEYNGEDFDAEVLLSSADGAMYEAKSVKEPEAQRTTRIVIGKVVDKRTGKLDFGRRKGD
ncbi:MAG: GGDEF domain-containing protein [Planctomycetes bacterium]|nr:GGDEF domain-containing protein [Planctomycetota bacterium]